MRMDGRDEDAMNFLATLRQRPTTFATLRLTKLLWMLPDTPGDFVRAKGQVRWHNSVAKILNCFKVRLS